MHRVYADFVEFKQSSTFLSGIQKLLLFEKCITRAFRFLPPNLLLSCFPLNTCLVGIKTMWNAPDSHTTVTFMVESTWNTSVWRGPLRSPKCMRADSPRNASTQVFPPALCAMRFGARGNIYIYIYIGCVAASCNDHSRNPRSRSFSFSAKRSKFRVKL